MAPTIPALPLIPKTTTNTKPKAVTTSPLSAKPLHPTSRSQALSTPRKLSTSPPEPGHPAKPIIQGPTSTASTTDDDSSKSPSSPSSKALIADEPLPPAKPFVKAILIDRKNRIRMIEPFSTYASVADLFESAIAAGVLTKHSRGLSLRFATGEHVHVEDMNEKRFGWVKERVRKLNVELDGMAEGARRREMSRVQVMDIPLPISTKREAW